MEIRELIIVLSDQKEEIEAVDVTKLCDRKEEKLLSLDSSLAQVVIGVRRSGKSTLCAKVLRQQALPFAYVNFDDDRLAGMQTSDFDKLLDALYQIYGDFQYLFIDEIQNVAGWQLFVNRLLRQKNHLFVTGSNSKLLSHELTTHLTGRYMKIELFPFSFSEYASMKGVDIHSLSVKARAFRKRALHEYLLDGGFPELLHESNRRGYVEALLNSIIKTDIANRFKVKYVEALRRMASYLADNFCQEFVASKTGMLFGVSDHTAENYYSYLKEAFLLLGVPKFSYKSKERVRNEKVYVVDSALVTEREGGFNAENLGWRLENAVCLELLRRNRPRYVDIYYYRESQWEVDFIVAKNGVVRQLMQVSYYISNEKTYNREIRGLVNAAKKFHCDNLLLINTEDEGDVVKGEFTIRKVLASEWLSRDPEA